VVATSGEYQEATASDVQHGGRNPKHLVGMNVGSNPEKEMLKG